MEKIRLFLLVLLCVALAGLQAGCGNGDDNGGDADAVDVADDDGAGVDIEEEDIPADGPVETEPDLPAEVEAVDDPVGEEPEEEAVEDVIEDTVEEEIISVECPIDEAGTGSFGGLVGRGADMLVTDLAETDGVGNIIVMVFDEDPTEADSPEPVAMAILPDADLSNAESLVEFCVQNIPPGNIWLGALMDDNGSGLDDGPSAGDIVSMNFVEENIGADESKTDIYVHMDVRIGLIYGEIDVDEELAASVEDLAGDMFIILINRLDDLAVVMGAAAYQDVDLSGGEPLSYEALILVPPPPAHTLYVAAIFDVDESGSGGRPQPGDLVNFELVAPPGESIMPPDVDYTYSGIVEEVNTALIWEVTE
ncbi:MAG: hypothetical protein ABIJ56_20675 [Pseudomonadota bacterium]